MNIIDITDRRLESEAAVREALVSLLKDTVLQGLRVADRHLTLGRYADLFSEATQVALTPLGAAIYREHGRAQPSPSS
jgi:hypothetical protein